MITFPRAFPSLCVAVKGETEPVPMQSFALTGAAQPNVIGLGPTRWETDAAVEVIGRDQIQIWDAWKNSLEGGLRTFQGVPVRGGRFYRWPLTRPTGFSGLTVSGSPWDGTGNLSVIGSGKDTITVNQMPNGLVLSVGDYLAFNVGSKRHLHQITEGATVSSNAATVGVYPIVSQAAVTSVEVFFESPWCHMVMMSLPKMSKDEKSRATLTFKAQQVRI